MSTLVTEVVQQSNLIGGREPEGVRLHTRTNFYPCGLAGPTPHAAYAPTALTGSHFATRPIYSIGHDTDVTRRSHGRVDL